MKIKLLVLNGNYVNLVFTLNMAKFSSFIVSFVFVYR